ncbi:hypothetical protein [Vreelandella profundi]|uniref:hypothetical protein n=1 Tax=Vreelandella profundi TaxID=2852117 RepID=UPI001F3AC860|nr:hypothetical protein [Halomonas profundi]
MEIGAAVTAVKGALDLARTAKDVNDRAQLNAAMSDIMDKLTTAQSDLLDLLTEHHRLIDENRGMKHELSQKARFEQYRMEKTPKGYFILKLRDEHISDDNPAHAICYLCKEEGKATPMSENSRNFCCPICNYVAWIQDKPPRYTKKRIVNSSVGL